jgi:hypothetical protein
MKSIVLSLLPAFAALALTPACAARLDGVPEGGGGAGRGASGSSGSCAGAGSRVVETAVTDDATRAITADDQFVYWTTWGSAWPGGAGEIAKAPIGGGDVIVLVRGQPTPWSLVVDRGDVYFTDFGEGTVKRVAKEGGPVVTLASLPGSQGIAVDDEAVYWTSIDSVMRLSKSGGEPVALTTGEGAPDAIVVDATSVYWVDDQAADGGGPALRKVDKRGGQPVTLASGALFDPTVREAGGGWVAQTWSLAQSGASLYWASYQESSVTRFDKATGQATTVATGLEGIDAIAVDASFVYAAEDAYAGEPGPRQIVRMPLSGGSPSTYATGPTTNGAGESSALSLAATATGVYFSTGYGNPGDVRELVLCDP